MIYAFTWRIVESRRPMTEKIANTAIAIAASGWLTPGVDVEVKT
jgi:hypothetical protein